MKKIHDNKLVDMVKKISNTLRRFLRWFWHASWLKKIGVIILSLILISVITSPFRAKKTQYTTDTVSRGSITSIVSESGNVTNAGAVDVPSITTGVIQTIYVANGDTISAGQNLFQVKSTASPQDQASAYANYLNAVSGEETAEQNKIGAQASLEQARQAVLTASSNVTTMHNNIGGSKNNPATGQSYTQNDIDSINSALTSARESFSEAEKKYEQAGAPIAAAQASVNSTWLTYQATQDSTVTAPVSGVVENLSVSVGDKVTASSNANAASAMAASSSLSPVLYITTNDTSTIKAQVNEVDIPQLRLGQSATITLPAISNKTFHGNIIKLDTIGTNTSGVITYNAYISITDPSDMIRPSMTADVDIKTAQHSNVLTVSNEAIKPYKGGKAVQVLTNKPAPNNLKFVPVVIGIKGINRSEILSGVTEGTKVVTGTVQPSPTPAAGGGV